MAAPIYAGDTVYLRNEEITITSVDDWTIPHRYHFVQDGKPLYCTRKDLKKRKPKK